jgi:outer membrane biosynthesis protein TonB
MSRRREQRWKPGPVVASLALHAGVVGLLAFSAGDAPAPPKTKVYAVDIVSPPPNVAGAPPTEALSNQEPGPAAPAAETPPAPAPDPTPPAPDPEPAPPREEAPKEPAKAPEPRRTPRPAQPAQRPSTTNPRPSTSNRPSTPTSEKNRPATNRPPATPEKNRPSAGGSSATGGTGSGPNRTRGDGTSTAPATGSNPQPGSPGGEGINIHVEGEPCPVAGYCERVTLQVQRYFRAPPDNAGARGEVCFRIQRDGSVTDIQAQRVRGGGGAAFRLAMMEAAEAAGSRRAFGTLPGAFDPQRWRWCVELSPR